ncbi:uncharacterized protein [Anabrus simplex]|uniref:uncharacterized protein n=1 Tax=Anabrus simplex TaxID=316456 RepID=UPI0035A346A2
MSTSLLILISSVLSVALAHKNRTDKYDDYGHHHYSDILLHDKYGGLYSLYDYSSLSTLVALKIKAALLVGLVVLGIYWFYKLYGAKGTQPLYHGHVAHDDHGYGPYKSGRNDGASLMERVMAGIDLVDLTFNIMDITTDACRRKAVCQMDKAALQQPLLGYAMNIFSGSLSNYRNVDQVLNKTADCASLYPECSMPEANVVDQTSLINNTIVRRSPALATT